MPSTAAGGGRWVVVVVAGERRGTESQGMQEALRDAARGCGVGPPKGLAGIMNWGTVHSQSAPLVSGLPPAKSLL